MDSQTKKFLFLYRFDNFYPEILNYLKQFVDQYIYSVGKMEGSNLSCLLLHLCNSTSVIACKNSEF
jgi:hypothetical protein